MDMRNITVCADNSTLLAGRQIVCTGKIHLGDVVILRDGSVIYVNDAFLPFTISVDAYCENGSYRVYRDIPTASELNNTLAPVAI